ncbi:MAG TPA: peptidylprolyl isomerase [Stellaceae bacterium]|nr:peptidylprolyl isomerase [Stellaceae bacterium]
MTVAVNGIEIPERAIAAEMQHHPAASLDAARDIATRALVVRELLLQEARRLGILEGEALPAEGADASETPEEAILRTLVAREVKVPTPDEAACRRYYETHPREMRAPDLFEARHILIAADPRDGDALARAKAAAASLIETLARDPGRFAELAEMHSDCPSKVQGGMLGQVARADVVPEFATFLEALEEGQLSPVPVVTRYGIHVLRLERRIAGRQLPYETLRERIADHLADTVWRRAIGQYVRILAGRARIEGIDIKGAATPLVQ